jgi:hypothetical protein
MTHAGSPRGLVKPGPFQVQKVVIERTAQRSKKADGQLKPVDRGLKPGQYRGQRGAVEVVPDEGFLQRMMQWQSLLFPVTCLGLPSSSAPGEHGMTSR